jgi:hypothetical protein
MMKKLLFIIVLFYSNIIFSADTKLPTFGFRAYLVCENISNKNELIANRYYLLESDKINLLKTWVTNFDINFTNEFKHFENDPKGVRKITQENEHHIYFEGGIELDKIMGILSFKTQDESSLILKCKNIKKDSFFLTN